ncbi:MAG: hypothetical protein M1840_007487 [Geoglossum simile]|nr:MAG: hypothetical protein M1840_007487 [Geoglossum simile]
MNRAGDRDSIKLLNGRATLKVRTREYEEAPEDVEEEWRGYLSELKNSWGQSPKSNPESPLEQALP